MCILLKCNSCSSAKHITYTVVYYYVYSLTILYELQSYTASGKVRELLYRIGGEETIPYLKLLSQYAPVRNTRSSVRIASALPEYCALHWVLFSS
jgi:hypothetical protein